MQIELSPDDIETIIREADAAARRLRRKLCLPICEREDPGQALLVDLLRRLPAYDPSRGNLLPQANVDVFTVSHSSRPRACSAEDPRPKRSRMKVSRHDR